MVSQASVWDARPGYASSAELEIIESNAGSRFTLIPLHHRVAICPMELRR
jgi:hypothetical protein